MELLKLLNFSELAIQVISFLIIFFILKHFFWTKILQALEDRKNKIADELATVEKHKQEAIQLKAEFYEKLNRIDDIAQGKIFEAVAQGRELTDQIRKKAHQDAQDIIENANRLVDQKIMKAEAEFKDKIIDISMRATELMIQEKLTEQQDKKIIEDFLNKIEQV
ncbi:MAG: F0F1 ATP synthase subunit B [Candidatus Omnitrophica bacterium]|nr:F0F1 ATP synthase subunit B [Candidatus Omnitrophota bacterium]